MHGFSPAGVRDGTFHESPRSLGIRRPPVVTIRNSSIEIIQSETYAQAALSGVLPGTAIWI